MAEMASWKAELNKVKVVGGKIASINIANTAFKRDDEKHVLNIYIVVENFGELNSIVNITADIFINSMSALLPPAEPSSLLFAPHQPKTLNRPLELTSEAYQAFLSGNVIVEASITAQYEEAKGIPRTFSYRGKLNSQTGLIDIVKEELK